MPQVFAWPPVSLTGYAHTISRPVQRAEGLQGAPYLSQSEPTRTLVAASVTGIGRHGDSGAYVEMLKQLLDGKLALVRLTPCPRHWHGALRGIDRIRGQVDLVWNDGATGITWSSGGQSILWKTVGKIQGTSGSDDWPYLDCTGFPPNIRVALPTEPISVGGVSALVLRTAVSDATGAARLYLSSALPSGSVLIGREPSKVFEIIDYPQTFQPAGGSYGYDFEMVERFETDFVDSLVDVNPWI